MAVADVSGDQKHMCQEVTGITELFEAWCCRQNENDIPIKNDTVAENWAKK